MEGTLLKKLINNAKKQNKKVKLTLSSNPEIRTFTLETNYKPGISDNHLIIDEKIIIDLKYIILAEII